CWLSCPGDLGQDADTRLSFQGLRRFASLGAKSRQSSGGSERRRPEPEAAEQRHTRDGRWSCGDARVLWRLRRGFCVLERLRAIQGNRRFSKGGGGGSSRLCEPGWITSRAGAPGILDGICRVCRFLYRCLVARACLASGPRQRGKVEEGG